MSITSWAPETKPKPVKEPLGLDFGIKTHVTLSDGRDWNLIVEETERHKRLQRKLQRQTKGSNRYEKTLSQLGRSYERLSNRKDEAAAKLVSELSGHVLVAYQDEQLAKWKRRYGRSIQHSALGRVKQRLALLPQGVKLDKWAPTTKLCPSCGCLNDLDLSERTYRCDCGYSQQRDVHAARNMLLLAAMGGWEANTPGEPGSASVEGGASAGELVSTVSTPCETGNGQPNESGRRSKSGKSAPNRRPISRP